jgi:hypothetical protein
MPRLLYKPHIRDINLNLKLGNLQIILRLHVMVYDKKEGTGRSWEEEFFARQNQEPIQA